MVGGADEVAHGELEAHRDLQHPRLLLLAHQLDGHLVLPVPGQGHHDGVGNGLIESPGANPHGGEVWQASKPLHLRMGCFVAPHFSTVNARLTFLSLICVQLGWMETN